MITTKKPDIIWVDLDISKIQKEIFDKPESLLKRAISLEMIMEHYKVTYMTARNWMDKAIASGCKISYRTQCTGRTIKYIVIPKDISKLRYVF